LLAGHDFHGETFTSDLTAQPRAMKKGSPGRQNWRRPGSEWKNTWCEPSSQTLIAAATPSPPTTWFHLLEVPLSRMRVPLSCKPVNAKRWLPRTGSPLAME